MKTSFVPKFLAVIAAGALTVAVAGCSAEDSPQEAAEAKVGTAAEAAEVVEAFFAATTSEEIAAALPEDKDGTAFDPALEFVAVEESDAEVLTGVLSEFALLKVSNPKSKFAVAVDPEKISVDADKATVHADAVIVNSDGKAVANSKDLAENLTTLIYQDDAWHLVIAEPEASPTATPSPTATESAKDGDPTPTPSETAPAKK